MSCIFVELATLPWNYTHNEINIECTSGLCVNAKPPWPNQEATSPEHRRHEIVRSFLVLTRPALLCWYNVDLVAGSDYPLAECTENGSVAVTVSHADPHRDTPPSHSQLSSSQVKTTFQSSTWKLLFKQHTWVHTCESGVGLGILCRRTLLLIVAVFGPCSHHWVGFAGLDCL